MPSGRVWVLAVGSSGGFLGLYTSPCHAGRVEFKVVFRSFRLVARFSKYDFWIPGEILD